MTSATAHSGLGLEQNLFNFYTLVCGGIFIFAPGVPVAGTWPDLSGEALDIAKVYAQVVGFLMWQALSTQCPGPRGLQMAMFAIIGGMCYHIFALGIYPPTPVMVGCGIVLASTFWSGMTSKDKHESSLSRSCFMLWNLIQAFTFYQTRQSGTGTPAISDSYPNIVQIPGALEATDVWCEVIATMSLMLVLLQCPGPLGRAMAMTANVGLAYYHFSKGIMPPPPVVLLSGSSCMLSWYTYFTVSAKSKAA
jgi:hypothetical protein